MHVERAQHVERDREQLERDEQRDEAVGGCQQAHARAREAEQRVVLGDAVAEAARAPAEQDRGHAARTHDRLHERGVAIGRELPAEGRAVAVVPEVPGAGARCCEGREPDHAARDACAPALDAADDEQEQGADGEQERGQDRAELHRRRRDAGRGGDHGAAFAVTAETMPRIESDTRWVTAYG